MICLERYTPQCIVVILNCGHTLHQACWDTAYAHALRDAEARGRLELNLRCPMCRTPATVISTRAHGTTRAASSGFATPDETAQPAQYLPVFADSPYYLTRSDGRLYVVLDTGAVGNLCGDGWAKLVAAKAIAQRLRPSQKRLAKPMEVGGVGTGTQTAYFEATLPLAVPLANNDGQGQAAIHPMTVPMVHESNLPCLWGLTSLTNNRAIVDLVSNKLYLVGPGDVQITLPPGTTTIAMEREPRSGHLIVPCDMYEEASQAVGSSSSSSTVRALHTTTVEETTTSTPATALAASAARASSHQ